MSLKVGSNGKAVGEMQKALDELGYSLNPDRAFGPLTQSAVRKFQADVGLPDTGEADLATLKHLYAMIAQLNGACPRLSPDGIQLIMDYEVGGGRPYYMSELKRPTWPGESSGVTIGVGYDLGYEKLDPWRGIISDSDYERLKSVLGVRGWKAKAKAQSVQSVVIDWEKAVQVFNNYTLPRQVRLTSKTFPGMENLHPDVQSVLVSLVFNRGSSMKGSTRKEMRTVRDCVITADLEGIADALIAMKRLWPGSLGLRRRRDAEAAMVRSIYKA